MKRNNKIWMIALLVLANWCAVAQEDDLPPQQPVDPKVREKVEAARIGMISNRLGLTPEQAEKFWPIYREFTQKRQEMRQELRQAQQSLDPNNSDPKKQQEIVNQTFQIRQRELNLEKDYSGRILSVITMQQMMELRKAEQDFRQLILNQLQQRRALQQRKENFRDKNQRLKLNRN